MLGLETRRVSKTQRHDLFEPALKSLLLGVQDNGGFNTAIADKFVNTSNKFIPESRHFTSVDR